MLDALRVNMSAIQIQSTIDRANEAIRTGINVDLMIRKIRALLESKFTFTLEIETIFVGLLANLLAIG